MLHNYYYMYNVLTGINVLLLLLFNIARWLR